MAKFILKFFILFTVAYLIAYIVNDVVDEGLSKSNLDNYEVWNNIYGSKINADVIISGPSKSLVQISPKILDSILHVNSYNIAMDGWTFNMQYTRFKIYLKHNKTPKYVIQNVNLRFFNEVPELYNYEQFLPYLQDTILKRATDQYIGKFTFAELNFPLFKYNNHFTLIWEGIKSYFNVDGQSYAHAGYDGYRPNDFTWDSSFDIHKKELSDSAYINPYDEKIFEDFLKLCKQRNIKVILEFPPEYYEALLMIKNDRQILDLLNGYAKKYDCVFLNYSKDSLCYNKKYFYNSQHLNKTGSEIYSVKLANDLKNVIIPQK